MNKLVAALVVGIVVALAVAGWEARKVSALTAKAEVADSLAKVAGVVAIAKETTFVHDSTRVLRSIRTVDTLLTTLIDSAVIHHTDTITVRVPILVAARDTLRVCQALVLTCADALAASRTEVAALVVARDTWKRAANAGRCWLGVPCPVVGIGVGATYANGQIHAGPTVSLIIPLKF